MCKNAVNLIGESIARTCRDNGSIIGLDSEFVTKLCKVEVKIHLVLQ